jgi:hypothetical protein
MFCELQIIICSQSSIYNIDNLPTKQQTIVLSVICMYLELSIFGIIFKAS